MAKIAKKKRVVKSPAGRLDKKKSPAGRLDKKKSPPRFALKKDTLGRRYATDKRTGKRVSVAKAQKERQKRRVEKPRIPRNLFKTSQLKFLRSGLRPESLEKARSELEAGHLHPVRIELWPGEPPVLGDGRHRLLAAAALGIKDYPAKVVTYGPRGGVRGERASTVQTDETVSGKKRSAAAKKGWETRRKRALVPIAVALGLPKPERREEPLIPRDIRTVPLEGIAERAARYPKVNAATEQAWYRLQAEAYARVVARSEGKPLPPMATRRFDQLHGEGAAERLRYELFTRAHDVGDLDQIIEDFLDEYGDDYDARELYGLYFSPDAA